MAKLLLKGRTYQKELLLRRTTLQRVGLQTYARGYVTKL